MLFLWFDHPLIEGWLERRLAASRLTTSHDDAASAPAEPPRDNRQEPLESEKTRTIDLDNLEKLADALGVNAAALISHASEEAAREAMKKGLGVAAKPFSCRPNASGSRGPAR